MPSSMILRRAWRMSWAAGLLVAACPCPTQAAPLWVQGTEQDPVSLGPVRCRAEDDVILGYGRVRPWEEVTCTSLAGSVWANSLQVAENGALRLQGEDVLLTGETLVPSGSSLVATVEGAPAPWGETGCTLGSEECNPCVADVPGTFEALFKDDDQQETYGWHLDPAGHYDPDGLVPKEVFDPGVASAHIQTLVRTNSPDRPLAAVYSRPLKKQRGTLLLIDADLELERIYYTWDKHPTGLVALGRTLLYADKGEEVTGTDAYVVRMFPLDTQGEWPAAYHGYLRLPDPELPEGRPQAGGGMTALRLTSGGFLLVTTGPGGRDKLLAKNEVKYTDFFYLLPAPGFDGPSPLTAMHDLPESLEFSAAIEHLARWTVNLADDPDDASYVAYNISENVSSVVECGSGEIYLIHSGVKRGIAGQLTFYRLSHVRWESGVGPQLDPIAWGTVAHDPACEGRASATVWADGSGGMELYCSEYRMTDHSDDTIRFTRRYLP